MKPAFLVILAAAAIGFPRTAIAQDAEAGTVIWYEHPAAKWADALPVGNGRLGAMVFGGVREERIQLNEDTLWSGGPYDQARPGGAAQLEAVQRAIFAGRYRDAHDLFGRGLMGQPVEQQKYQCLANLVLGFEHEGEPTDYRHELDLDRAVVTTRYRIGDVGYRREVFASAPDQVVVVRIAADRPGTIRLRAELRGVRNQAHSNYGTDYFRMDGVGGDGLRVTGKSADYLGIAGALRYEARLLAVSEGARPRFADRSLRIDGADAVTLYIAAATSFVDHRDAGADPAARVDAVFERLAGRTREAILADHVADHRRLFRRVALDLGSTERDLWPTDRRRREYEPALDPGLASLVFQFGRYVLIASSRPGTEPANLQGIWNESQNPSWDSKYTTNINTEMNYWPAEVANLADCAEPLFEMIGELSETGRRVAREHYGKDGWVFHQNTDLWRAAAPMDGPDWGTFTTGGAWLCTHLWEHWRFSMDREFLARVYPWMRDGARFFAGFLVEHPERAWLVTNPSTSPENFPARPGNDPFYDEVTGWVSPGTSICAGSTIDMQLLRDLFAQTAAAAAELGVDADFAAELLALRERLAPMQVGADGALQEWLEDWPQKEASHRHISHLYGLFPGHQIDVEATPALAAAARAVLEQRGLDGNGWSSAWKAACWARLREPEPALANLRHYLHSYATDSLFAICQGAMQVDGACGMTAAIAELLLQSQGSEIIPLPALPAAWPDGSVRGLRARGGFEVDLSWRAGRLERLELRSLRGAPCSLRLPDGVQHLAIPAGQPHVWTANRRIGARHQFNDFDRR
jgi:alpha-L-fucosidase 2